MGDLECESEDQGRMLGMEIGMEVGFQLLVLYVLLLLLGEEKVELVNDDVGGAWLRV